MAAGIGSMIFDFTDPIYIASSPFTLVFKFTMGFLCGWIAYARQREGRRVGYNFLGAVVGQGAYMVLYLSKSFLEDIFFKQVETQTALVDVGTKALTSGANAVIAVLISVPLALALRKALSYTTIYQKIMHAKS